MNEDNPAMYVSVDNFHEKRAQKGRLLENIKHQMEIDNIITDNKKYLRSRNVSSAGNNRIAKNQYFDCKIHFETEKPIGKYLLTGLPRVIYDKVRNRKIYFEIPAFLLFVSVFVFI